MSNQPRGLALLSILLAACATRVGNPPKPALVAVPVVEELLPEASSPAAAPDGAFPGAVDFLGSLGASSPRGRAVLVGMNAEAKQIETMQLELDVGGSKVVNGIEVKAIVRSDAADPTVRRAVMCAGGVPFYQATWKDGSTDVVSIVDLATDPLQAYATIAESERRFVVQVAFAKTTERSELDMTLVGTPGSNDPFVGDLASVLERARYRTRPEDDSIVYQGTQLWYAEAPVAGALPQVTVAGLLGSAGAYEYAIHHTEAQLVCEADLDRAAVDQPGWCVGYVAAAGGASGAFTGPEAAQTFWTGIRGDGLIDPATTLAPALTEACPN